MGEYISILLIDGEGQGRPRDRWRVPMLKQQVRMSRSTMAPIELRITPGPAEGENKALFDRETLLYRLEDDEELMAEVLELYLDDAAEHLDELSVAIASGDVGTVALKAHSLKGASANVSSQAMSDLAYHLERLGKAGDLADAESLLVELTEKLAALRTLLTV